MTFGPIRTAGAVERAAEATLTRWLRHYLAEAARQDGHVDTDPRPAFPRSISTFTRFTSWQEMQLPAVLIVSPGTVGEPTRSGRGEWSAWWRLGVWALVGASDAQATRRLAHRYAAAIRTCLLSHPTLDGACDRLDWMGETYDQVDTDAARTLTAAGVDLRVHMTDVAGQGPRVMPAPEPDPWKPWPGDHIATTVTVDHTVRPPA